MKQLLIGLLLGLVIGSLAYHFLLKIEPETTISDCPPFVIQSTKFAEDTVYKRKYLANHPEMSNNILRFDAPVDTATLNTYVRNYKRKYSGATYSCVLGIGDVTRITDMGSDVRIYFGLKEAGNPKSGTTILTGVNSLGGDVYIKNGTDHFGIDQASPCPTDCPFSLREAVMDANTVPDIGPIKPNPALNPLKAMLGRLWDIDPRVK